MQVDINARHVSTTDALRSPAGWRLRFALTWFDVHIHRVVTSTGLLRGHVRRGEVSAQAATSARDKQVDEAF